MRGCNKLGLDLIMYEYNVTIARVVDGDTVDIWIDLGFDVQHFRACSYGMGSTLQRAAPATLGKRYSARGLQPACRGTLACRG